MTCKRLLPQHYTNRNNRKVLITKHIRIQLKQKINKKLLYRNLAKVKYKIVNYHVMLKGFFSLTPTLIVIEKSEKSGNP